MAVIKTVNEPSAPGLEYYTSSEVALARLREPEPGVFIAESEKVLLRALDAGFRPVSLLMEKRLAGSEEGAALIRRCEEAFHAPGPACSGPGEDSCGFPVYTAEYDVLKDLVGYHLTGGILCAMDRKPLPTVAEVCKNAKRIAILENVVNPTNIGAIFRSAAALNIDAVLLTLACCDPLYRRAIRVSMGNVFLVPWTYMRPLRRRSTSDNHWEGTGDADPYLSAFLHGDNRSPAVPVSGEAAGSVAHHSPEDSGCSAAVPASEGAGIGASSFTQAQEAPALDRQGWPSPWLDRIRAMGFTTVAMALSDDSVSISDPRLKQADKLAIVLGTEGDGLLARTIARCDYTAKIPMAGGVDSLNVAAASAVAFWELRNH